MRLQMIWISPFRATMTAERGRQMKTAEMISYKYITSDGYMHSRIIESEFVTDLRSGGRWCDLLIPKIGDTVYPSVLHDDAYRNQNCDRHTADNIMLEACYKYKVKTWRILIIYCGLRLFGWIDWNNNKTKLEAMRNE